MIDLCQLNSSMCPNSGECIVNISSNTTYCQCDPCHYGIFCENDVRREPPFNHDYPDFITSIILVFFSLLNNGLIFELFICCRRIRSTNCGIYLFVYSILSLLSYILLVTSQALQYYPNQLNSDSNPNKALQCFITGLDAETLFYLCIWFSSLIAFERGLIICFGGKMNATRWRAFVAIIVMLAIASGSITPLLVYRCDWNVPNLKTIRNILVGFFIITGILIYLVATVIILISFSRRIRYYGMENGSRIKTFLNLLKTHLFIFVPPIAYGICQLPFSIVASTTNSKDSYFRCGISLGEYIIKVLMESLTNTPYALTWLLFVCPSQVYMNEFYLNTWSGNRLYKILSFFISSNDREENVFPSLTSSTDNEDDKPIYVVEISD